MTTATAVLPEKSSELKTQSSGARRQIRGSTMLLAGQLVSKLVTFLSHVLVVRYLSRTDYGAFAYVLAVLKLGDHFSDFGLHRAINRFVPIYQERNEIDKASGTVVLAFGTTLTLGLLTALGVHLVSDLLAATVISDQRIIPLLLILVFLLPLDALDKLVVGMFAVFASPRAIFFRRHVLGPALKTTVILLVVLGNFGVRGLAVGYLIASLLGLAVYAAVLWKLLSQHGFLRHLRIGRLRLPWREILSYTTPLLTTDLVYLLITVLTTVLLEHYGGVTGVAGVRAVLPLAMLNDIVFKTFALLYAPQAARLYARGDRAGSKELYWQTATWIAVMTLPIFIATFSLAKPITVLLLGQRYEQSGLLLGILALGYYGQAALGFNGRTLAVFGEVRYLVVLNCIVSAASLIMSLLLIPAYGALGAAICMAGALILHNVMKQVGLHRRVGIDMFERRYARVYVHIFVGTAALFLLQLFTALPIFVNIALAVALFVWIWRVVSRQLDVSRTFPEIAKVPLVGWLLAS